ncbi:MAG: ACT domain-containing protein [Candidatus Micrarchaeota archaeon]
MKTISNLQELLKNMKPTLSKGKFYMASIDESELMALAGYADYITDIFREKEGLSIVFSEEIKEEMESLTEKKIFGPFALITLNVYSDLMAVGFLAKITETLAKEKISVNAFSAYNHDHLFVPYERKEDALKALQKLQKS